MALALTYPGVYVQSIIQPSPPNSGVPTSTAAFIGRTASGPVNTPVVLNSWGDYQRFFGGLAADSSISYQINAFFNNGGGQAIAVRLFHPDIEADEVRAALEDELDGWIGDAKTAAEATASAQDGQRAAAKSVEAAALGKIGNEAWVLGNILAQIEQLPLQKLDTSKKELLDLTPQEFADSLGGIINTAMPDFVAALNLNLINPVYSAFHTVITGLQLLGASITDHSKTGTLLAATKATTSPYSRGAAGPAMGKIYAAIAAQPTVPLAMEAMGASWLDALGTIPALDIATRPNPDPAPTDTASDMDKAAYAYANGAVVAAKAVGGDPEYQKLKAAASGASVEDALASVVATVKAKADAITDPKARAAAEYVLAALGDIGHAAESYADIAICAYGAAAGWIKNNWPDSAGLTLRASNPGSWGNRLTALIDTDGINIAVAARYKLKPAELFNLTVIYADPFGSETRETFSCVTLNNASPDRYLAAVLADQSALVRYEGHAAATTPPAPPSGSAGKGAGGNDSDELDLSAYLGDEDKKTGLYALEKVPIFNILCIPPDKDGGDTDPFIYQTAAAYCARPTTNAMLIIDPPTKWQASFKSGMIQNISLEALGSFGAEEGRSAATYFPRVIAADPLRNGVARVMPNSGYMAGIWAQTDTMVGVWKAPAGLTAAINGIVGLESVMNDAENGMLNPLGINSLRTFPIGGSVVWGARTMRGADQLGDEYNYVPVRRMLLYIMDWVLANTKWAVFEPNDERLWSGLRLQIGTFMSGLWRQGAFFGTSADKAFFVKCDATTTQSVDRDAGRVNVQIGFAPVKPAEFVVVTVQQIAATAS